jgi:hypothetical protein
MVFSIARHGDTNLKQRNPHFSKVTSIISLNMCNINTTQQESYKPYGVENLAICACDMHKHEGHPKGNSTKSY